MKSYDADLLEAREKYAKTVEEFNKVWFVTLSEKEQALVHPYLSRMMSALVVQAKLEQIVFPQAFIGEGIGE